MTRHTQVRLRRLLGDVHRHPPVSLTCTHAACGVAAVHVRLSQLQLHHVYFAAVRCVLCRSPGMQIALDVSFRPVQSEEYDDGIDVSLQPSGKSFRIPVIARLPKLSVSLDRSEIDLGLVPVGEVVKATIKLQNTGAARCLCVCVCVCVCAAVCDDGAPAVSWCVVDAACLTPLCDAVHVLCCGDARCGGVV